MFLLLVDPAGGSSGGGPGFFTKLTQVCTTPTLYKTQRVKTVREAIEIKKKHGGKPPTQKLNSFQKGVKKATNIGVLGGVGAIAVSGASLYIDSKLGEENFLHSFLTANVPLTAIGGALSLLIGLLGKNQYEESIAGELDEYVDRTTVSKDGSAVTAGGAEVDPFPAMDDIVAVQSTKDGMSAAVRRLMSEGRGGYLNNFGKTHNGKTFSTKALARVFAELSPTGKCQYWFATGKLIDKTMTDKSGSIDFFGIRIGGESLNERLNRVAAEAVLTDEPVVLVIDEGESWIGVDRDMFGGDFNSHDPAKRSKIANEFAKFVSETLKTKGCENVCVVVTSNLSGGKINANALTRADGNFEWNNATPELVRDGLAVYMRKQLEKNKENEKLKKLGLDLSPNSSDMQKLGELGQMGLVDLIDYFGKGNTTRGEQSLHMLGLGTHLRELDSVPVLDMHSVEKVAIDSINDFINDSTKTTKEDFYKLVEEKLEQAVAGKVSNSGLLDELKYQFGIKKDSGSSGGMPFVGGGSLSEEDLQRITAANAGGAAALLKALGVVSADFTITPPAESAETN